MQASISGCPFAGQFLPQKTIVSVTFPNTNLDRPEKPSVTVTALTFKDRQFSNLEKHQPQSLSQSIHQPSHSPP
ncbi:MAG: hypothetical protein RML75_19440 [Cyanobacteriota bacterium SKYGB_h_bin112]|nr:hypothetical protein [Cyanobacteriota bacterium SKYGB_h_bin112]